MLSKPVLIIVFVGIAIATAFALFMYYPGAARTDESSHFPTVLTGENIYGYSLDHWAHAYWAWTVGFRPEDAEIDPQTTLHKCIMSSDPDNIMIFLVDPYDLTYNGKCTISSEKPMLVPLLISWMENSGEFASYTKEQLWASAKEANEVFRSWDVRLDGKSFFKKVGNDEVNIELLDKILVRNSTMVKLEFPEHNRGDIDPGTYDVVVDGYYLILEPLSPGTHTLEYKITHEMKIPGADLSYVQGDVTYTLEVK